MWCRPHGGAGEVPPVSKWIKRLDVWMSPPSFPASDLKAPQGADRGPRWSLEASWSPQVMDPHVPPSCGDVRQSAEQLILQQTDTAHFILA